MSNLVFGFAAGVVLAVAGTNIVDNPAKTVLLLLALIVAHIATGGEA